MTAHVRARELLFPVLLLPVQVPVLLATVSATESVLAGPAARRRGALAPAPGRRRPRLPRRRAPDLRVHPGRMSARHDDTRSLGLAGSRCWPSPPGSSRASASAARGRAGQRPAHHVPARARGARRAISPSSSSWCGERRLSRDAAPGLGPAAPAAAAEIGVLFTGLTIVVGVDLGQADLGHLVDVGRAADLDRGAAPRLRRATCCCAPWSRSPSARARYRRRGRHRRARRNIPIVHFSVYWWRTLHQPSTILGPGPAHHRRRVHRCALARERRRLHAALRLLPRARAWRSRASRRRLLARDDAGQLGLRRRRLRRRRGALLVGYWRHLGRARDPRARRAPAAKPAGGAPMSRAREVPRRRPRHRGRARLPDLRGRDASPSSTSSRRPSSGPRRCRARPTGSGGMVKPGTLKWEPKTARPRLRPLRRQGHDRRSRHKGTPPDLFARGTRRGGRGHAGARDGYFKAVADPGQALRGVQGAARREPGRATRSCSKTLRGGEASADDPRDRLRAHRGRARRSRCTARGAAALGARSGRPALRGVRRSTPPSACSC